MSILLPESPEEVNFLNAFAEQLPELFAIAVFAPLVYIVVLGKNGGPAKRIKKIAKALRRPPQA
ncbi:hypothetical protein [Rathayibacter sp. VKM Ac-2801]|uniref:hypothetical protein n=1 Tax=Rathayibacter sp. VKM Ac-2801 TaxID=2609255 RepID=UPI001320147B|nr:hypothetical protein [Rathayibacter sp. VKM Ac-2801]QHC72225.1 hypothetical protein GSU45_16990 [Rathayibacter sp. VKM Ac-2801]